MPKFEVTVTLTRDLTFVVDAVNEDEAGKLVLESNDLDPIRESDATQTIKAASRKLEPKELVFKFQIDNIRRDYEELTKTQKLPSGEIVDDATAETMKSHLITMHDNLVTQSGLDIPKLGEPGNLIAEHLGDDAIPAKKEPVHIDNPQLIWEKCATAFGWEFDEDYKGWIKPGNIKEGARRGEWDAFPRDLTAEDACNEEGIDTVEEAAEAIS
jgi:hypothetical protein